MFIKVIFFFYDEKHKKFLIVLIRLVMSSIMKTRSRTVQEDRQMMQIQVN